MFARERAFGESVKIQGQEQCESQKDVNKKIFTETLTHRNSEHRSSTHCPVNTRLRNYKPRAATLDLVYYSSNQCEIRYRDNTSNQGCYLASHGRTEIYQIIQQNCKQTRLSARQINTTNHQPKGCQYEAIWAVTTLVYRIDDTIRYVSSIH